LWSEGVLWEEEEEEEEGDQLSITLALLRGVFLIDKSLPNFDLKKM